MDPQLAFLISKAIDVAMTINNRDVVVSHINEQAAAGKSYQEISDSLDKLMDDAIAAAQSAADAEIARRRR